MHFCGTAPKESQSGYAQLACPLVGSFTLRSLRTTSQQGDNMHQIWVFFRQNGPRATQPTPMNDAKHLGAVQLFLCQRCEAFGISRSGRGARRATQQRCCHTRPAGSARCAVPGGPEEALRYGHARAGSPACQGRVPACVGLLKRRVCIGVHFGVRSQLASGFRERQAGGLSNP